MKKSEPLYKIIKNDIKNKIQTQLYLPGQKIPSEAELGTQFNASRITVVRAINDLVSEGYLRREQGKGSFVCHQINEGVLHLTGFTERMKSHNYDLKTIVIEKKYAPIPLKMAIQFNRPINEEVIFIKRLRIVNNQPLCISHTYFIKDDHEWLMEEGLENQSVYKLLENKYHQSLGNATQVFSVGYLDSNDSSLLNLTDKNPCLCLTIFAYLSNEEPFEYDQTYYNSSLYQYEINMIR
ncbi:MAG: GntR family transcriptional regulator [Coprobacillus sp.]